MAQHLSWFQWMCRNGQSNSCNELLRSLEIRFAPSQYEDPQGALIKQKQTNTVAEYHSQFESLSH